MNKKYDLVLGAGGIKGYLHIGALRAIEELGIPIGTVTGVSVGAAVATLYTNGFDSQKLLAEFNRRSMRIPDFDFWMRTLTVPNLRQLMTSWSCISIEGLWQQVVEEEKLVPNNRLQIVAHDVAASRPVLFKGTNYVLHQAVAASGSVPRLFTPVCIGNQVLVDGALYHYNPTEFSRSPAIVLRLNKATAWPTELLNPMDFYYHWRELYLPLVQTGSHEVDETKHIVIDLPSPDVAALAFGISQQRRMQMVEDGYRVAHAVLSKAIADGRIVLPATR